MSNAFTTVLLQEVLQFLPLKSALKLRAAALDGRQSCTTVLDWQTAQVKEQNGKEERWLAPVLRAVRQTAGKYEVKEVSNQLMLANMKDPVAHSCIRGVSLFHLVYEMAKCFDAISKHFTGAGEEQFVLEFDTQTKSNPRYPHPYDVLVIYTPKHVFIDETRPAQLKIDLVGIASGEGDDWTTILLDENLVPQGFLNEGDGEVHQGEELSDLFRSNNFFAQQLKSVLATPICGVLTDFGRRLTEFGYRRSGKRDAVMRLIGRHFSIAAY